MEVVVKTDYQDIYRINYGILLIVNKYKDDEKWENVFCWTSSKAKPYNKLTQNLKILREDFSDKYCGGDNIIPKGTVVDGCPVRICDVNDYTYSIKTTGSYFSGDFEITNSYLDDIKSVMNSYRF